MSLYSIRTIKQASAARLLVLFTANIANDLNVDQPRLASLFLAANSDEHYTCHMC